MKNKKGFTLIELLIVIAIIAILAAVVFVALDPLTRFQDSRDSARWSDITGVLGAIKIDQVDNGGSYLTAVSDMTAGSVYMIVDGTTATGCDDNNTYCDVNVTADTSCVNLAALVTEGYIGSVPVSPDGDGTWLSTITGYTLQRDATGILTVRACESENTDAIEVAR
jgi:prepilin-type N-terminal cleavage/methylation domain-containing protein